MKRIGIEEENKDYQAKDMKGFFFAEGEYVCFARHLQQSDLMGTLCIQYNFSQRLMCLNFSSEVQGK